MSGLNRQEREARARGLQALSNVGLKMPIIMGANLEMYITVPFSFKWMTDDFLYLLGTGYDNQEKLDLSAKELKAELLKTHKLLSKCLSL